MPRLRKRAPKMVDATGVAIRAVRLSLGWSQDELAGELGVAPLTVTRWERCKTRPHRSNLDRIHAVAQANGRSFR
jgi:transcriptional regulator with XRE-family HTH domain